MSVTAGDGAGEDNNKVRCDMRSGIALVFAVLLILSGIYFGIVWGFIGGIIQVISSITPAILPAGIAWGLAKIFILAPTFGWGLIAVGLVLASWVAR